MDLRDVGINIAYASNTFQDVIKTVIADSGLNPNEFAVLELLYRGGDKPIQKLGKRIQIASSSITYVVDKLENKGYLRRKPCSTDRRVMYACLTESGEQLMKKLLPIQEAKLQELFKGFSNQDIEILNNMLKRVEENAEQICGKVGV